MRPLLTALSRPAALVPIILLIAVPFHLVACTTDAPPSAKNLVVVSGGGAEVAVDATGKPQAAPAVANADALARFAFSCCKTPLVTAVVIGAVDLAERMAADDQAGTDAALKVLQQAAQAASSDDALAQPSREQATQIATTAEALVGQPLPALRSSLPSLSVDVAALARDNQGGDQQVVSAFCPMEPGHWLQRQGSIQNPYFGADMLTCGTLEDLAEAR